MIYYSDKARESAQNKIKESIRLISEIPGNILSYTDACTIVGQLGLLSDIIAKEEKEFNSTVSK